MDLISIIVPVYNVEAYLKRCIESIINQTYKDIEIILVDDGSTDNSSKICDEYKNKDKRIKVIHKVNGGLSSARNRGLDIAKGKYIGFVDSDDYISPKMYEILYKELINNKADMAMCDSIYIKNDNKIINDYNITIFTKKDAIKRLLTTDNKVNPSAWNKLYKKELFKNIRYPIGFVYEDIITTYLIINKCKKIVYLNCKLYKYNVRNNSIINYKNKNTIYNKLEIVEKRAKLIKKEYPDYLNLVINNYIRHLVFTILDIYSLNNKDFKNDIFLKKRIDYFKKTKIKVLNIKYIGKRAYILFMFLKINIPITSYIYKLCKN